MSQHRQISVARISAGDWRKYLSKDTNRSKDQGQILREEGEESWQQKLKPLSHSTAIPRRWHGDLKLLRAPWDRTKIQENIRNDFTFSITWRCHGVPMATVAFPWRAHGVSPRCYGVLTCDWLRGHGALMACSWRAKSCHCASTACTQRALRAQCVSTASSQSVNEHIKKSAPGILQKSPCI